MFEMNAFRTTGLLVSAGAIALLSACGGDDDTAAAVPEATTGSDTAGSEVPYGLVTPEQAAELATDDSIVVLDVRTAEEYAEGHLADAEMIDFYGATFADEIAALDRDQTYLLYCRSGNRSGQTADLMAQLGFERVYDMNGGINAYSAAGLPLVR